MTTIGPDMHINAEETLRNVVTAIANVYRTLPKSYRPPLWSLVSEKTYMGGTYSSALCRWAGFDPTTGERLVSHASE